VVTDAAWAARLRQVRALTGGLLHPMAAYALHRGLQTLAVRVRAQQQNAQALAEWFLGHEGIAGVRYPGLPGQDPHGLIGRQMSGAGSMLAIQVEGGYAAASTVLTALRLVVHAVSLGGVDTLAQHPASLTHRPVAEGAKPGQDLLRISVGLEDLTDLQADFDQALRAARR